MSDNEIGKKMYERRKALGLTLEDVGEAVGVGKSTVRKWENGMIKNMGRDKISALANVLKMSPVEFVPGPVDFKTVRIETPHPRSAIDILIEEEKRDNVIDARSGVAKAPISVDKVEIDPQFKSMMKLWKVSTPKARKSAIELLKILQEPSGKE